MPHMPHRFHLPTKDETIPQERLLAAIRAFKALLQRAILH